MRDEDQKTFDGKLNFKIDLLSYELNTEYIEDTLVELEKCYNSEKVPHQILIVIPADGKKKLQIFNF